MTVLLDDQNQLHLCIINENNNVYCSSSDISKALSPHGWADYHQFIDASVSSIAMISSDGSLYLAYTQITPPFDVFITRSDDFGATWSYPALVSNASIHNEISVSVSTAAGPDGTLHIAWAQHKSPDGYPPQRIYYAQSKDQGEIWSAPLEIASGEYGAPTLLVTPDNNVYLEYNGAASIGGRYFRYSNDGGQRWSGTTTIDPGVGGLTGGSLALDSAGMLHFASASDAHQYNGIAYSQWDSKQWTPMFSLIDQPEGTGTNDRWAFEPNLVITNGNQLHILYLGANHDEVRYITSRSSAPEIPVNTTVENPTPTAQITPTQPEVKTSNESDISSTPAAVFSTESFATEDTAAPIWLGVFAVMVLIIVVFTFYHIRRNKK